MNHDLELARLASPDVTYEWAKLLLARAHFNGSLATLDVAWQRVVAYGRGDSRVTEPAELMIRCTDAPKAGPSRRLRLHRRFDRRGEKIFIVADEAYERGTGGQ